MSEGPNVGHVKGSVLFSVKLSGCNHPSAVFKNKIKGLEPEIFLNLFFRRCLS